jgi:hypothetical protein
LGLIVKAAPVTAAASGDLVLAQAAADVAGCSLQVTAKEAQNPGLLSAASIPGSVYIVFGSFDFDVAGTSGNGLLTGQLVVDAAVQTPKAVYNDTGINQRSTTDQQWIVTGLSPGNHTFKLQGLKQNAAGTGTIRAANTALVVIELAASYLD